LITIILLLPKPSIGKLLGAINTVKEAGTSSIPTKDLIYS